MCSSPHFRTMTMSVVIFDLSRHIAFALASHSPTLNGNSKDDGMDGFIWKARVTYKI
jgi:hypothetical protein